MALNDPLGIKEVIMQPLTHIPAPGKGSQAFKQKAGHSFKQRDQTGPGKGGFATSAAIESLCDLCGASLPASMLITIRGPAQLCAYCYNRYAAMPDGTPHQCIERYLMGNII
jgi:hypothetical protein